MMDYSLDYESASIQSRPLVMGEPNNYDVLFGRGNHVHYHPGNIRFRRLASAKSQAYTSTRTKKEKRTIAAQLIQEVSEKGGRFLRQVEPSSTGPEQQDAAWEVMTGQIVSTKVRQAMRDTMKAKGDTQTPLGSSLVLLGQVSESDTGRYPEEMGLQEPCLLLHPPDVFHIAEKGRNLMKPVGSYQESQSGVRPPTSLSPQISGFEDCSKLTSVGIHQLSDSQTPRFPSGYARNNNGADWQPAIATSLEGILRQHLLQQQPLASPLTDDIFSADTAGFIGRGDPHFPNGPTLLHDFLLQRTLQNHQYQRDLSQILTTSGQQLQETNNPLLHYGQQHTLLEPYQPLAPPHDEISSSVNNVLALLPQPDEMMGEPDPWIGYHPQFATMEVSPMAPDEQNSMLQTLEPLPLFDHDASTYYDAPPQEDCLYALQNMDCA